MKIQFNEAQLSRPQQESLIKVLDVLQAENEIELVVWPVDFPLKLRVMLDGDIEMLLGWDAEKKSYAGLTTPERLEQDIKDLASETIPESEKDTVDLPGPEPEPEPEPSPELVKSEIGQRVEALAQALVNLTKPLNTYQRGEVWIQFCIIYVKGVME